MSTTPRTDAECIQIYTEDVTGCVDAVDYVCASFARELETELACEKENRNLLIEKGAKLETELAAAQAERDQLSAEVKRWQAEAEEMSAQRSHNANQAGRLRAELAVAENWVSHHSKHADDLIAENVKLRADLERFTGHGLLDCHAICDQRDAAIARAERAEGALAEWSVLNLWGGTPEIIHEFIKGQQNRIHHCQDLETELAHLRAAIDAAMKEACK